MTARVVEVSWPTTGQTLVTDSIGRDEVVAFHFKAPADTKGKNGNIAIVEFNGPPCHRSGSLSTSLGDMHGSEAFVDNPAPRCYFHGSGPWGETKHGDSKKGPELSPGGDYYLNVKNDNPQAGVDQFPVQVTLTRFA